MTPEQISNTFCKLITNGYMVWKTVDRTTLDDCTIEFLDQLDQAGLTYQIGHIRLEGALVIKIDDPKLPYLERMPKLGIHQWPNQTYTGGQDANSCLAYLHSKVLKLNGGEDEKARLLYDWLDSYRRPDVDRN